jgi:DNA mismatch repair protein MutS
MAELDVLFSLAEAADRFDYVRPRVDLSHDFSVQEARHPMVERFLPAGTFVPNSLTLNETNPQILLLTGPNMAGKSTFLRQNALIAIMAQMGSFVPARDARLGLVDRVLTRIGAQDALARGESTFMVEMKETAFILQSATARSLLILDEVGRGTSTYDGISIARAVVEHLAGQGPKVLFATHYFELTELARILPGVKNANVQVKEWVNGQGKTEVVFLHKIADGPADRSYGIHVAELAGLPASVIARAKTVLEDLERGPRLGEDDAPLLPMFQDHPVLDELRVLVPEKMTPLEALQKLNDWKRRA